MLGSEDYRKVLILGNVNKEDVVLRDLEREGIQVVRFRQISRYLRDKADRTETTDGRRFAQLMRLDRQTRNRPTYCPKCGLGTPYKKSPKRCAQCRLPITWR